MLIVHPETRARVAPDHVGEVWVRGPGVAGGYLGRPDESQETFGACLEMGKGRFLRTGDLAFKKGIVGQLRQILSEEYGLQLHLAVLVRTGGIPRTSSGKIQRRQCRSMFEAGDLDEIARG